MVRLLFVLLLAAPSLFAADPAEVAFLVLEKDREAVKAGVSAALEAPDALSRATAARVATVRDLTDLAPRILQLLATEKDPIAAREQIRAAAILSPELPLDALIAASRRFPSGMDEALSNAIARRSPASVELWGKMRELRAVDSDFFATALWGRHDLAGVTGSRLLREHDTRGWMALMRALEEAGIAPDTGLLIAALDSKSEEIRSDTIWTLVRRYVAEPSTMPAHLRAVLLAERAEAGSDREEFGRELARRMLGEKARTNPRWLEWLATPEADVLLKIDDTLDKFLNSDELRVRVKRCGMVATRCPAPPGSDPQRIPSTRVRPADYFLPDLLPPGLAQRVLAARRCRAEWIGVGSATVDRAGRVQSINLGNTVLSRSCAAALETLTRLTLARNSSLASAFKTPDLLFVRPGGATPCIDESRPDETSGFGGALPIGGEVTPPQVTKRVEPEFPETVRGAMGAGKDVLIIIEAVITKEGCVRSARILSQSPYPELNAAALLALSKWKFTPGRLNGKPVDVIFNLTVRFSVTQ